MKVVILCGGKGTRFREKTESIPKVLAEVGGKPILWHIMKIYSYYGFQDFILCLGYKGQMIKEYFMDSVSWKSQDFTLDLRSKQSPNFSPAHKEAEKWKISFVDTGEETNTGGRLKKIASLIEDDTFMATYGDGVSNVDIRKLLKFHHKHGKIATVTAVNPPSQFGVMEFNKRSGIVSRFREKPATQQWINGGFFVFQKEFLKYLGANDVLEKAPLEKLTRERQLLAFQHRSFWKCMDTFKDMVQLNEIWASGKAPWQLWEEK